MSHIYVHLEKVYGIKGDKKIEHAVVVDADKIQKNKVLDFFESLKWDGKERLETFFYDFFRVELNPFTRVAFKHWLVGAVSRIYKAGSPMDYLLIIKGKQGIGKSLFFKKLATMDFGKPTDHLYSDTKIDFDRAKDSYEQLEGIWIYEWKELAGMNMSEQESIKAFVDKTEDKFRRSYGRRNVEIKRRVAFGGSTNEKTPLRDRTGNRRFLVMESQLNQQECYIKDPKKFNQEYKDQLIAEAIQLYKNGYDIFQWTDQEMDYWDKTNEDNLTANDFIGLIGSYVSMKRPYTWYSMSQNDMRLYVDAYDFQNNNTSLITYQKQPLVDPEKMCIQEIWFICLKQKEPTINRFHRELIVQAMEHLGWVHEKRQTRFGVFGNQNTFSRVGRSIDELPF
jgi:predicted P-loop ATPase